MGSALQVSFYQVKGSLPSAVEDVLPKLLEKVIGAGNTVLVRTNSAERSDRLNEYLWTYENTSFLPHGTYDEPHAEQQPILISHKDDVPNKANVLLLLGGVDAGDTSKFERVLDMFNSADAQVKEARKRWKKWSDEGKAQLSYFAHENGKWVKKA